MPAPLAVRVLGWCLVCRGEIREETRLVARGGAGLALEVVSRIVCDCPAARHT